MGDRSNLMFTTGMTWFCLVAKSSEHGKDFVSGDAFESLFLCVAEPAEEPKMYIKSSMNRVFNGRNFSSCKNFC